MDLKKIDPILRLVPAIPAPQKPPSHAMRLAISLIIIAGFMLLMNIPITGLPFAAQNSAQMLFLFMLNPSAYSIVELGILPILASILLISVIRAKLVKTKTEGEEHKERMHKVEMLLSIIIAIVLAALFAAANSYFAITSQYATPGPIILIFIELMVGFLIILYVEDAGRIYGVTSGVNLFILSEIALLFIYGVFDAVIPSLSLIALGSTNTASYLVLSLLPILAQIIIIAISFHAYGRYIQPSVKVQARITGVDQDKPYLYIGPLAVVSALMLLLLLSVFFSPPSSIFSRIGTIFSPHNVLFYPVIGESYSTFFTYTFFSSNPTVIPFIGIQSLPVYITDIAYGIMLLILTAAFSIIWRMLLSREQGADTDKLKSEDMAFLKGGIIPALILLLSIFIGVIGGFGLVVTGIILAMIYDSNHTLVNDTLKKIRQSS